MQPAFNLNLDEQLAALALSSPSSSETPLSPRTPRRRSAKNLGFIFNQRKPDVSDVKLPTGKESGEDLKRDLEYAQKRRADVQGELEKLQKTENRTPSDNEAIAANMAALRQIDEVIEKIGDNRRESARMKRQSYKGFSKEQALAACAEYKQKYQERGQKQKLAEVSVIFNRLNDTSSAARDLELEARLNDIRSIILGLPSTSGHVTTISKSIEELWRTASNTAIKSAGKKVQLIHENAHNREAPEDKPDVRFRFQTLFKLFQVMSKDTTECPDTSKWEYEDCCRWAEKMEKENPFNELMRRYLRSASQAMYTGSLSHEEVLKFAPNLPKVSNSLFATVTACGQEIYRHFHDDRTSKIKIILPYEMKSRAKLELFAKIVAQYTISFDDEMQATSMRCRVLSLEYADKKPSPPLSPDRSK